MKVLFAVNNVEISESIVKKYQKNYKEIISYKNVYYFNAILKEIQKDKSYDRIIISEDLEQFTNTSFEQMDKFIFERLDSISDEASSSKGEGIPIILICTERRRKSEEFLVKLFGIGVYNAIIGNDRSIDEVCRLIYKPRLKKEAKTYYQIEAENVSYKAENENDVSEVEIQNILAHFKRLGKNESKYLESYDKLAEQYNDNQLKVISKFLPLGVRAVLEEKSSKYQQVMAFNKAVSNTIRKTKDSTDDGLSQKLLINPKRAKVLEKPIVIPTSMSSSQEAKKLTRKVNPKPIEVEDSQMDEEDEIFDEPITLPGTDENIYESEIVEPKLEEIVETEPKRKRGRPRKTPEPTENEEIKPKRGRGRPRKNPIPEESTVQEDEIGLFEFEPEEQEEKTIPIPDTDMKETYGQTTLPGILENDENEETIILPDQENEEPTNEIDDFDDLNDLNHREPDFRSQSIPQQYEQNTNIYNPTTNNDNHEEVNVDLSSILQGNKKVAAFVGTSKNGTSFIVNNVAELLSSTGVNVAILDTTKNKNSYYIYTKNEEELRRTAMSSITNLANGIASGIRVNSNLAVYTSLPNEEVGIEKVQSILETLVKSHTVVLIDCDFQTPKGYFSAAQEVYLIQTMDVLTIQPLTAFLKDLVTLNILDEHKIRVIINKYVRIRGITEKEIIGGMAYYNAPDMTYQTELFDKATAKYLTISFEEDIYTKYLEGLINCEISLKGYSKNFLQNLKQLGNMVYPIAAGKSSYTPPALGNTGGSNFSSSMNDTLDRMKRNY